MKRPAVKQQTTVAGDGTADALHAIGPMIGDLFTGAVMAFFQTAWPIRSFKRWNW
jgi:hypothetical protein